MQKKIKVGITGSAGYTGGELLRLLIHHPAVELVFAHSKSNAGKPVYEVHTDLLGDTDLRFSDGITGDIDLLFLCLGHHASKKFLEENSIPEHIKIIDLSQDFRIRTKNEKWIYGLPELNRTAIQSGDYHIANPGCFATAIQLALLPLAKAGLLKHAVHVNATTGSTGAGQSLSDTTHFSWRTNNLSAYKSFEHQHLHEIRQSLRDAQEAFSEEIHFIPNRGAFARGIFATLYTESELSEAEAQTLFEQYYETHPFVFISEAEISLKQVVNTNKCLLTIKKQGKQLMITSVIDNLLKGASGQAVQNMNLLFGLDEKAGLKLKATAF